MSVPSDPGLSRDGKSLEDLMDTGSLHKMFRAALRTAAEAAEGAGAMLRRHLHSLKAVEMTAPHDIKLELDVRTQGWIQRQLVRAFPDIPVVGEEGNSGEEARDFRWVVDPIDGTVNFAHNIPHACVCVALQARSEILPSDLPRACGTGKWVPVVGVVYDPFVDELWTAIRGEAARLNKRTIHVSRTIRLEEAIVMFGFAKSRANLEKSLPYFSWLARRVRKVRIMGSAGLGLAYVACGRFDAYVERQVRLWDIAAGSLLVECAGGKFWTRPWDQSETGREAYAMVASNGLIDPLLPRPK
ncbi:MAG: inositol monophosphatase family protein [Verrucomicrobiota bacterium]|nr:inositol monophosphatase family protein [Verrucomicrobiota bacterium]